jgi:hypothetical protein
VRAPRVGRLDDEISHRHGTATPWGIESLLVKTWQEVIFYPLEPTGLNASSLTRRLTLFYKNSAA